MRYGRSEGGFTLLELLVTISVIGIVLLVAAPALPAPAAEATDTGAVRTLLLRAAATSARLDRPVSVVVDPATGAIEMRSGDSLTSSHRLPVGNTSVASAAEIHFLPDGRASGGPVVMLSAAGSATVAVDPWTSRATVDRR